MKRFISIILSVVMMLSVIAIAPINVSAGIVQPILTKGDYRYRKLDDGTVELTGYIGSDQAEVVVPSTHANRTVSMIGSSCFTRHKEITKIVIPNTVTTIDAYAFNECTQLTEVVIPSSVTTMGGGVFSYCSSIKKVSIPASVKTIAFGLFHGCDALEVVEVDKNNPYLDSRNNCNAIIEKATKKLIAGCNTTVIPYGVEIIGNSAFHHSDVMTKMDIPNSVKTIEFQAFYQCESLKEIFIPASVTSIVMEPYNRAFGECERVSKIEVDPNNRVYDSRNNCNAIIETATNTLIIGCRNTVIPNTVKTIGKYAFYGLFNVDSMDIPSSVTYIDFYAFNLCWPLKKIIFRNPNVNFYDSGSTIYEDAIMYGYVNSTAHQYAIKYDRVFNPIEDLEEPTEPKPIKVENVHVTNLTHSLFIVEWDQLKDAEEYYVYIDDELFTTTNSTVFTTSGRDTNRTYKVQIIAKLNDGTMLNLEDADVLYVTPTYPPTEKPTKVENVQAFDVGTDTFSLNWNILNDATGYAVYIDGVLTKTTSLPYVNIDGCESNRTYKVQVVASLSDGTILNLEDADVVYVTTAKEIETPIKVENVHATNITYDSFVINWDEVDNAEYYKIFIDGVEIGWANAPATSYTVTGRTQGKTYNVQVIAKIKGQDWMLIDDADTVKVTIPKQVIKVSNVHATDITQNSFVINWDPVEGALYYKVIVDGDEYDWTSAPNTSLTVTGRQIASTSKVQVIAEVKGQGWMLEENADIVEVSTSGRVEGLKVVDATKFEIDIKWDAFPGAIGYQVWVNDGKYDFTTDTSMTIIKRSPNTLYNICVTASFEGDRHFKKPDAQVVQVVTDNYESKTIWTEYEFDVPEAAKNSEAAWIRYGKTVETITDYQRINKGEDTFTIPNLDYGTDYYYTFKYMENGRPVETDPIRVTTEVDTTFDAVRGTFSDGVLVLNWEQLNDADFYWILVNGVEKYDSKDNSAFTMPEFNKNDVVSVIARYDYQGEPRPYKYQDLKLSDVIK